ncbi:cardiolipin synthase [uncultured Vagococcus sp.]|uniref:cardiolipin synthase n=1 Tax=uncultured Vagococcus sp. TaxID=189676 RepID=UPI0028D55EFE|nr:cardiolipin synthase [uncultured Vagococcus sp.]
MKNKLSQIKLVLGLLIVSLVIVGYFMPRVFVYLLVLSEALGLLISLELLLFDKRGTTSKIAWILTIHLLPYVGIVLFLFLGRNPARRRLADNQLKEQVKIKEAVRAMTTTSGNIEQEVPQFARYNQVLSGQEVVGGNQFKVLTNGRATYDAILAAISQAEDHIHMFFFIFKEEEIGKKIIQLLIEKATQGVEVRFAADSLGTLTFSFETVKKMEAAGIEVLAYDPVNTIFTASHLNWRNHRKTVVIDGKVGFTGGVNVGDEYLSISDRFDFWRDSHLKVEGPLVNYLQESFLYDWMYMSNQQDASAPFISIAGRERYFAGERVGEDSGQIIYGGPYDKERLVRESFLNFISGAKKNVRIAMPYFVPDEESLAVLRRMALNGIKVQVLMPGKGDRGISFNGSNHFIKTMIEAGAEVYHYQEDSFLHCKIMIVDDQYGTIGTTNFDVRSFRLNHELSLFLTNADQAVAHLVSDFEADLTVSTPVTLATLAQRPLMTKIREQLSSLFAPIL